MFTTGSKLLIGSAALAWLGAAVYGIAQEGALGTIGLVSVAVALSLLAGINAYVRDSNVSAMDTESFESSAAAQATANPSLWPFAVALGVTTMTLGLATFPAIFILGVIVVVAAGLEWIFQGWSERASADKAYNAEVREVMADPIELPVAGAVLFGIVVYAFSRVMLGTPSKESTVITFSVVGAVILAVGVFVALKRDASRAAIGGMFSVGLVALIASGAVAGLNGERDVHEHETTADLAEENECGPEETEADEKASQTVASKSSVTAELTFDGSSIEVEAPGVDDGTYDTLTLPRSNPNPILFHNESDMEARLVIDLFPEVDADGEPLGPARLCTTLVEEGGTTFLTVEFDRPSFALADGETYAFTVAGTDVGLPVVVP